MSRIARILVPTDFSPGSERAATYAVELAETLGASVLLLHTWELPVYAVPDGAVSFGADVMSRVEVAVTKEAEALAAKLRTPRVDVQARAVQGPPAFEIVRRAPELGVDLIVMGTHGRTGLAHVLLGSVAERVVRTSTIPVLTVPPDRSKPATREGRSTP
jgi:nucleotide-binding universal stress UspA family protein